MHADLMAGAGFCFLDPHGDASHAIASMTPKERMNHVIYLDPSDPTHTFAYNPLSGVIEAERATTTANIVSAFKNIWGDSWGPRMNYILTNTLRLLMDVKVQSLLGIPRVYADKAYRGWLAKRSLDPVIKFYWQHEFEGYDARLRNEAVAPIQNKIGTLLSNPFIRSILCQNSSTLDLADIMNSGKVLIMNLSKGNLGTEPAHLLGALMISGISQAAEARRNMPEADRRDFTLYVDEFQNFATESFASILSEARKWRLSLVAANQHVSQLSEPLQQAVFGNAGTIVAFRIGAQDSSQVAAELGLENHKALRETDNYHAWLRLMRNGTPMEPHPIKMLPEPTPGKRFAKVASLSRGRYMVPRGVINEHIAAVFEGVKAGKGRQKGRRHPDWK